MDVIKVGDKVTRYLTTHGSDSPHSVKDAPPDDRPWEGTVIWVHPLKRFYVAEFKLPGGTVRQAYYYTGGGF